MQKVKNRDKLLPQSAAIHIPADNNSLYSAVIIGHFALLDS
ncbi:MAG: hypothetical protein AAF770_00180 [Bacteroidota bacterium]